MTTHMVEVGPSAIRQLCCGEDAVADSETVLMIARPEKLSLTDSEVEKWFVGLKGIPYRGPHARVWFEDFDMLVQDRTRAPTIADAKLNELTLAWVKLAPEQTRRAPVYRAVAGRNGNEQRLAAPKRQPLEQFPNRLVAEDG